MDNINAKIEVFLEKWNEMMDAANDIDGFKWKFSVSITSDNSLLPERFSDIRSLPANTSSAPLQSPVLATSSLP